MLGMYGSSEIVCKDFGIMCSDKDTYSWNNLQLTWTDNPSKIDYYVIINNLAPGDNSYYDHKKTLLFQMEPAEYFKNIILDTSQFMHIHSHDKYLNNVQWYMKCSIDELMKPKEKTINKVLSVVSENTFYEGHKLRRDFIKYMEDNSTDLNEVFGQQNYHNFKNYKGILPDDNKTALFPYKYYFMPENHQEYNYATEKIWEPILCESLCFYWGCPNLHEYIDPQAYVQLPLDNFEESLKIVKQAIEEDWWSQRIDIIKREKQKIINELGFFPTLNKLINKTKQLKTKTFYSQDKQDRYLEENIFKGYKNGIFVDVGAHDGISLNNTLYFENTNNWTGINVEPIKEVYDKLIINRSTCININCAINNTDGTAEFICNTGYTEMISGLKNEFDPRHMNRLINENNAYGSQTNIIIVNTKKLETIFIENNITHINYLSIDVEGAEFEVIKSINFNKVFIDVIGFENNYNDTSIPIINYLQNNDYSIIYNSLDIFMINNKSKFII
jgi:FkbM family methyltransferase